MTTRSGRFRPCLESLEDREVLSWTISGGVLKISGTNERDVVSVTQYTSKDELWIWEQTFDAQGKRIAQEHKVEKLSKVSSIEFRGGAGDDAFSYVIPGVSADPKTPPKGKVLTVTAYGGEGDDLLNGHAGSDHLFGEGGNDRLVGNGGSDHLDGGKNRVAKAGRYEFDFLFGGGGNDVLIGGDGEDHLFGGEGVDELYGFLKGNDIDHYEDYLTGGPQVGSVADIYHAEMLEANGKPILINGKPVFVDMVDIKGQLLNEYLPKE